MVGFASSKEHRQLGVTESFQNLYIMAVMQRYPEHTRSLILNSLLPEFVNIDEQELANFNEVQTSLLGRGWTTGDVHQGVFR